MTTASLQRDDLMPQTPQGMGRGLALALLVHVGLIAALAFGVNWRASEPQSMEAELWAAVPQAAAPRAVEPEPAPPPPPREVARPQPPREEPRPDAQIAIEKEKVRREKLKQQQAQEEQERQARLKQQERLKDEQLKQDKLKQERLAKAEADKKEAERKRREAAERAAEQLEAQRQANLKRILGQAGASGGADSKGTAAQSKGPSAGYAGRILAYLKPLSTFTDSVAGNPKTEVEVRLSASGAIVGTRVLRSSGVPAWDQAVLRALEKAERLPLDTDGVVRSPIVVVWGPNE